MEWGPLSPPQNAIFWIKHFRGKLQKVNPHYFSILRGVCFLHFFRKTAVSTSNWYFNSKTSKRGNIWLFMRNCVFMKNRHFPVFSTHKNLFPKNKKVFTAQFRDTLSTRQHATLQNSMTNEYEYLTSAWCTRKIVLLILHDHSYPKWEYKIKNVSEVCYIFLKSKLYDDSKKYFSKIFGLGPSPLTPVSFERSILEKNF